MTTLPILHGYSRSTASCRVRIALNLKGIAYRDAFHNLRKGEQRAADYLALNPQGLVPALEIDGAVLTQSMAICDYLEETRSSPALLPADPLTRAKVRAVAQVIGCDTHPIQNLKILNRLRGGGATEQQVSDWAAAIIEDGLSACASLIEEGSGAFCFGDTVTLADVFLIPQLVNARRFGAEIPALLRDIEAACLQLDAFVRAAPERQPDFEA